ncbi:MAG: hypothetical protein NCW75_12690 [Phycisphaera sp.]|nr:MAG: hypothetical protein NCW75_12690 [Phycisphaera sp.]
MKLVQILSISLTLAFLVACSEPETPKMTVQYPMTLELVGFDGCPNTPSLRQELFNALELGGWSTQFEDIDLTQLNEDDPRRRFAAPSILVDSKDLFGELPSASGELGCRIYQDGLPTADQIADQLRGLVGS